jgi:hypothetical protein
MPSAPIPSFNTKPGNAAKPRPKPASGSAPTDPSVRVSSPQITDPSTRVSGR